MASKFESAQEELSRRIKELCAFGDKMGLRIAVIVKTKPAVPFAQPAQGKREPGEN